MSRTVKGIRRKSSHPRDPQCLRYPDRPFGNEPILDPFTKRVLVVPEDLPTDRRYNKERKLAELVRDSLSDRRKLFVYAVYTGEKDVTSRLRDMLADDGVSADVLRASVSPEDREE